MGSVLLSYSRKDKPSADCAWKTIAQSNFGDAAWYTRDGALITTNWDGGVREYDAATLTLRHTLMHSARVWKARPSHDEQMIATAVHGDPLVRIWRRGASQPDHRLEHEAQVRGLEFSFDDRLLATGSDGGGCGIWPQAPVSGSSSIRASSGRSYSIRPAAEARVPRHLTTAEWRQYLPDEPAREV